MFVSQQFAYLKKTLSNSGYVAILNYQVLGKFLSSLISNFFIYYFTNSFEMQLHPGKLTKFRVAIGSYWLIRHHHCG